MPFPEADFSKGAAKAHVVRIADILPRCENETCAAYSSLLYVPMSQTGRDAPLAL